MEEDPFSSLHIDDTAFLDELGGRSRCPSCDKSRKYYCYTCYIPVPEIQDKVPKVKLPIKIDIIKHPSEVDGKSTAIHAGIISHEDVTIYTYPCIPDYLDRSKVLLVFPGEEAVTVEHLAHTMMPNKTPGKSESNIRPTERMAQSNTDTTKSTAELHKEGNTIKCSDSDKQQSCIDDDALISGIDTESSNECSQLKNETVINENKEKLKRALDKSWNDSHLPCKIKKSSTDVDTGTKNKLSVETISKTLPVELDSKRKTENESSTLEKCEFQNKEVLNGSIESMASKDSSLDNQPRLVPYLPFERVVFVDSTWNQTRSICGDERLKGLQHVEIQTRKTNFWRHQKDIPDTYLSTIEAVYYFLRDYHDHFVPSEYNGEYDNLLFFFSFMYKKIRHMYSGGETLKAYQQRK